MWKILISDEIHETDLKRLCDVAFIIENPYYKLGRKTISKEELLDIVKDIDAAIIGSDPFDKDVINAAKKLRIIARFGVGYNNIDIKSAVRRGIVVTYAPCESLIVSVAEHALSLIFSLAKILQPLDKYTRDGSWNRISPPAAQELRGKTLGVIGLGKIGSLVAKMAQGIGMAVIFYDKYIHEDKQRVARKVSLNDLLIQSDFISVHAPLTEETRGMIGKKELALMKSSAYLINTARGAIIDQRALYEILSCGGIAGAGLDVFEQEPPSNDDPILKLNNIILTPHTASNTMQAKREMSYITTEDVLKVLRGEAPLNPVPYP